MDAVAMYPSLQKETTAKICAEQVVTSGVKIQEIVWGEAPLYLALTHTTEEIRALNLPPDILPTRKSKRGPAPNITTEEVMGLIDKDARSCRFNPPRRSPMTVYPPGGSHFPI